MSATAFFFGLRVRNCIVWTACPQVRVYTATAVCHATRLGSDSSISALLCNAAPPENLVHVWDPAFRTHRLLFDMTPIYVVGRTLLDLISWHLPPIWHDIFIWIDCGYPLVFHRNFGIDQFASLGPVGRIAQQQCVAREDVLGLTIISQPRLAHWTHRGHWKL